MPVTAAVLNLSDDPVERRVALDALDEDPRVEVGARKELYLPVVVTTDRIDEGIELVDEELPAREGIEFVRIVRVDFDDADAADEIDDGWAAQRLG
ncbi:MAG: hypothetical protein ABEL76_09730 [Bradymonadaceae bacterium]